MELVDVDVIRLQEPQRGLKLRPEVLRGLRLGLGGDINLIAPSLKQLLKGVSQLLLAVAVGAGCIEKAHAALVGPAQDAHGCLHIHPLYGQGAEGVLGDGDACASQGYHFHVRSLSLFF